jgi:hypothetical protein
MSAKQECPPRAGISLSTAISRADSIAGRRWKLCSQRRESGKAFALAALDEFRDMSRFLAPTP